MSEIYKFRKEYKGTMWYSDYYSVEAESYEEAEKLFLEIIKNNKYGKNFDYSESNYDTFSEISPKDNDNCSTVELYSEDKEELIWDNSNEIS